MTVDLTVDAVLVGRPVAFGPNGEPSGIHKTPCAGPVFVTETGLAGDGQGDTKRHGGPEKALHHYPAEHYAAWRQEMPELPSLVPEPGGFGENLSTTGLDEAGVCIGDVFELGTARVQVAQGRQPCWRLNLRFGTNDMARRVQATGRTGWYYRVLSPGFVTPGDRLFLVHRPNPAWPLTRLLDILYRDMLNADALAAMAQLPNLAESWRALARSRLERQDIEDWTRRLTTPGRL
ncbi:MOSC domain-containing protein [Rhodovibrio sodomensis]|uniref:MOSC domain-containing protein n=1 Tax=Rhodovibrio sodomensis TaxID=1088 RepID=A0ABS1DJV2_9PROT|nr:MOSC domain-containing protein [Rhodovibrio sodomensis]MBK1670484.1 MOSC domain-containing protein [Rhodovibrio sodomensis]